MSPWSLFARMFMGPVCLALASVFHGWVVVALLALGALATLFAFIQTQQALSSASARRAAESILNTAVEFLHASGVKKVRANFMILDRNGGIKMKFKSTAYGKFEVENNWRMGDGSCASNAVERGVPVLGGRPGEWEGIEPNVSFTVRVMEMRILENEEIRSVLCVPVSGRGFDGPIGVITFDDIVPLNKSRLAEPAILTAVKEVSNSWMDTVR